MVLNDTMRYAVDTADCIPGWMAREDLEWLALEASKRFIAVELGTYHGRSAKAMASCIGERLYCIDTFANHDFQASIPPATVPPWDGVRANLAAEIASGKVELVRADTADGVRSLIARGVRPQMVFIDAGHEYHEVARDIRNSMTLMGGPGSGGLLCGHDFEPGLFDGVVRAVAQLVPGCTLPTNGVLWAKVI